MPVKPDSREFQSDVMLVSKRKKMRKRDDSISLAPRTVVGASFFAVFVLGGLGLLAAYEYGMVHDDSLRLLGRQGLFLAAGLALASDLAFTPRLQALARFRQHAIWGSFAVGILLLLVG